MKVRVLCIICNVMQPSVVFNDKQQSQKMSSALPGHSTIQKYSKKRNRKFLRISSSVLSYALTADSRGVDPKHTVYHSTL